MRNRNIGLTGFKQIHDICVNTTNGNILRLEWGLCDGLVIIVEDEEVGGQSPPQGGVHVHTGVLLLHASVYIGNPASKGPQYSTVLT